MLAAGGPERAGCSPVPVPGAGCVPLPPRRHRGQAAQQMLPGVPDTVARTGSVAGDKVGSKRCLQKAFFFFLNLFFSSRVLFLVSAARCGLHFSHFLLLCLGSVVGTVAHPFCRAHKVPAPCCSHPKSSLPPPGVALATLCHPGNARRGQDTSLWAPRAPPLRGQCWEKGCTSGSEVNN